VQPLVCRVVLSCVEFPTRTSRVLRSHWPCFPLALLLHSFPRALAGPVCAVCDGFFHCVSIASVPPDVNSACTLYAGLQSPGCGVCACARSFVKRVGVSQAVQLTAAHTHCGPARHWRSGIRLTAGLRECILHAHSRKETNMCSLLTYLVISCVTALVVAQVIHWGNGD